MLQSRLFTKTTKATPRGEVSVNAALLERGGFVRKLHAGVYSYLPLGLRVLRKIEAIVREGMASVDAEELLLPALQNKELWETTGRWKTLAPIMYRFQDGARKDVGLAVTHEEVVAALAQQFVASYKDLPFAVYQIQTKFRFEPRPKSGLLRGREFSMKDLYSGHVSQEDCDVFYERVKDAYSAIFERMSLQARITEAPGGDFSDAMSHEFQVLCETGEDTIRYCRNCSWAQNKELGAAPATCPACGKNGIEEGKAIEVGNIFKLGTKYTAALGATFTTAKGSVEPIVMASYGIGISRLLGTIVELHHDDRGIVWPEAVAPFDAHVLFIGKDDATRKRARSLTAALERKGVEVLLDDRERSPGEKFSDADLLGIPHRFVVSDRNGENIEYRTRAVAAARVLPPDQAVGLL